MKAVHKEVLHKVRPQLMDLERERRAMQETHQVRTNYILLVLVALILVFVCLFIVFTWAIKTLLMLSFGAMGLAIYLIRNYKYPDVNALRKSVGNTVMQSLHPEWVYTANAYMPRRYFTHMGLTESFSHMEGQHMTHGCHGESDFSFSFVKLYNVGKNKQTTVFEGLILVADFHKEIKGKTLVFPDEAQQLMGSWLGKKVQEGGYKGLDLVYLEDPVFEEQFVVYSSDQVEARYVLTTSMMDRLLKLSKKYDNKLSFAFAYGRVCVTIDGLVPAEINLDAAIKPDGTFHQFSRPIELVTEVIDAMELNTRIWEKD